MTKQLAAAVVTLALAVAVGCTTESTSVETTTTTEAPATTETTTTTVETTTTTEAELPSPDDVDWSNYLPGVREIIEEAIPARDCAALQQQFDVADQRNDPLGGVSTTDLLVYLDDLMGALGCYD